jgi:6-phosphogluconolactonase (cycloisomerase 2 family)
MKFSKSSQLFLVSSIGLLVATFLTACSITTIDFVYVASTAVSGSSGGGQIETYAVDSQSGALRTGGAAVSSGGVDPVAMALTSDYANLYVANAGDGSIVHFTIGLNGVPTKKDSVTLSAAPVALAVNTAGTYLYVVSQVTAPSGSPACTLDSSGFLTVYPLSSGTIGAPATLPAFSVTGYAGDVIVPTGISVLANSSTISGNGVFVSAYDQSAYEPNCTTSSTANPGWVFGFTAGSDGSLTAVSNSPYQAGVRPSAVASDPTDRFLYVTDYASNELIGYTIESGNSLSFITSGPFKTGNEPSALAIDPRGKFIYVTNALDNTVSSYAITLASGALSVASGVTGSQLNQTDTDPVAVAIDPALGRFVYTANYLGKSVSGFRLDPTAGGLTANQATPYPTTGTEPTAVVVIPHGNHATQSVFQ